MENFHTHRSPIAKKKQHRLKSFDIQIIDENHKVFMHFYDIEIFVQYVTLSLKLKLMKLFLKTLCNAYMTL